MLNNRIKQYSKGLIFCYDLLAALGAHRANPRADCNPPGHPSVRFRGGGLQTSPHGIRDRSLAHAIEFSQAGGRQCHGHHRDQPGRDGATNRALRRAGIPVGALCRGDGNSTRGLRDYGRGDALPDDGAGKPGRADGPETGDRG